MSEWGNPIVFIDNDLVVSHCVRNNQTQNLKCKVQNYGVVPPVGGKRRHSYTFRFTLNVLRLSIERSEMRSGVNLAN